jgi:hypothetical protein
MSPRITIGGCIYIWLVGASAGISSVSPWCLSASSSTITSAMCSTTSPSNSTTPSKTPNPNTQAPKTSKPNNREQPSAAVMVRTQVPSTMRRGSSITPRWKFIRLSGGRRFRIRFRRRIGRPWRRLGGFEWVAVGEFGLEGLDHTLCGAGS